MSAKKLLVTVDNGMKTSASADMSSALSTTGTGDDESLDISFMSRSFCIAGLPLRRQFERDKLTRKAIEPQREATRFNRSDRQFSFTVEGKLLTLPRDPEPLHIPIGVPYGARARLLILWMTTQARIGGDRWLELGKISEWLASVGMSHNSDGALAAKEQLIRLSFATFTMIFNDREGKREFFNDNQLVETKVFGEDEMFHYAQGNIAKVRYPLGLQLSVPAFDHFSGGDVIPVSTEALREIANNAMAIDIFVYLNYRLPYIRSEEMQEVSWSKLAKQFGNIGDTGTRFRQVFEASVEKALRAYRNADVRITERGLELRYSPHAGTRRTLVAVPRTAEPIVIDQTTRVRNRISPPKPKHINIGASNKQTEMDF